MGTIEEADVVHHIKNGNGNHTGTEIPVVSWQWWIGMTKKEVVVWENEDIRIGVGEDEDDDSGREIYKVDQVWIYK